MFEDLREDLRKEYPEAHLDLIEPVEDDADAIARVDRFCEKFAAAAPCAPELDQQKEFTAYVHEFAQIIGADPQKTSTAIEQLATGGLVAGSILDLLLAEGSAHAAHAADLVDAATHASAAVEALASLGISVTLSFATWLFFKKLNGPKARRASDLAELAFLNGRLAKDLMDPGRMDRLNETLLRVCAQEEGALTDVVVSGNPVG
jgi:hypothetical protein